MSVQNYHWFPWQSNGWETSKRWKQISMRDLCLDQEPTRKHHWEFIENACQIWNKWKTLVIIIHATKTPSSYHWRFIESSSTRSHQVHITEGSTKPAMPPGQMVKPPDTSNQTQVITRYWEQRHDIKFGVAGTEYPTATVGIKGLHRQQDARNKPLFL